MAPLILGLILGTGIETQLRRALIGSDGDWGVLLSSPMATTLMVLAVILLFAPLLLQNRFGRRLSLARDVHAAEDTKENS